MKDDGTGMNSSEAKKKRTFEESCARMRQLKEEIDAQRGSGSLTEALYQDREYGFRVPVAEDDRKLIGKK